MKSYPVLVGLGQVAGAREPLENLLFQLSYIILCTLKDTNTLGQGYFILLEQADVESLNTALLPLSFIKVKSLDSWNLFA